MTRGTLTLIGAAAAGFLIWLATFIGAEGQGDYWVFVGLMAAAGLMIPVSQLLGGWTKWGWPRISGSVFLLGFLPVLIAGGFVVLDAQPDSGAFGTGWSEAVGLGWLAEDLGGALPAIAFAIGLFFGLTFDTTGPRLEREEVVEEDRRRYVGPVPVGRRTPADEPVAAERREVPPETVEPYREPAREGELVGTRGDGDGERHRSRRFFRRG